MGSSRPPRSTSTASSIRAGRPKSNSSLIAARTLRPVYSTSSTSTMVAPSTSNGSSVRLRTGLQARSARSRRDRRRRRCSRPMVARDQRLQALGQPRAAGVDADERGVVRDAAAHLLGQRRAQPSASASGRLSAPFARRASLQDELRRDLVALGASARGRAALRPDVSAAWVVKRSSTPTTGHPNRPSSARAKRSRPRGHRVRRAVGVHGQPDDELLRLPFVDQRRDRGETRRRSEPVDRRSGCATRASVLPNATPIRRVPKSNASTVACRQRAGHGRHACPTASDSREKSMPRRRIAAGSRSSAGSSNSTSGSAATVSHAFCASSCSSWPADHPA